MVEKTSPYQALILKFLVNLKEFNLGNTHNNKQFN